VTETDRPDMGQAKSIWGRELCQAKHLHAGEEGRHDLQLLTMPCLELAERVFAGRD
jgi:hypothetical protein